MATSSFPKSNSVEIELETSSAETSLAPTAHALDEARASSPIPRGFLVRDRSEWTPRLTIWGAAVAVVGVPIVLMLSATLLIPSESLEVSSERTRSPLFSSPNGFESTALGAELGPTPEVDPLSPSPPGAAPLRVRPRPDTETNVRSGRRGFSPVRDRPEEQVRAVQTAPPAAPPQQALTGATPSPFVLKATPAAAPVRGAAVPATAAPVEPAPQEEGEPKGAPSEPTTPPLVAGSTESTEAPLDPVAPENAQHSEAAQAEGSTGQAESLD